MQGEHHDLIHEFPEHRDRIHDLKIGDARFAQLFAEYHEVDREVRRHEQGVEPVADEYLETLKKKRLHLKDELYAIIVGRTA